MGRLSWQALLKGGVALFCSWAGEHSLNSVQTRVGSDWASANPCSASNGLSPRDDIAKGMFAVEPLSQGGLAAHYPFTPDTLERTPDGQVGTAWHGMAAVAAGVAAGRQREPLSTCVDSGGNQQMWKCHSHSEISAIHLW